MTKFHHGVVSGRVFCEGNPFILKTIYGHYMSIIVGVLFYVNMGTECGNYRGLCLTVSDYSENSTVHGVKYITDKVTFMNEKT